MSFGSLDQFCDYIIESSSINEQINKYEYFVEDVLKNDLQRVSKQYENTCEKIADYMNIKSTIITIQSKQIKKIKSMNDLGSNCYVKCVIPNTERLYLDVGLNCFVEFTLEEALKFINKKVEVYNKLLEMLVESSAKIKAHIKIVLNLIDQLRNEI